MELDSFNSQSGSYVSRWKSKAFPSIMEGTIPNGIKKTESYDLFHKVFVKKEKFLTTKQKKGNGKQKKMRHVTFQTKSKELRRQTPRGGYSHEMVRQHCFFRVSGI